MILHLGVIDIPYAQAPKKNRRRVAAGTQTTGDVAEWLENKYHPMENFYELHKDEIALDLEEGLAGALESIMMGAPLNMNAFGSATSKIEERFRTFIDTREMESLGFPGVPTMAAQRGVNHRMKHPYARRAPRPSFQDTGLYETSQKAWVD